jgi:hypothetical protein
MKTFLEECRRRRVFRLAGMYVVGCWVLLQVADLAFESWGISPVAMRYVWIAAIIGLPVALFFGWRFDIVGGRIIRTDDGVTHADLSLQAMDYLILTAVAAVLFAAIYGIGSELSSSIEPTARQAATKPADPRSIAVLPFSIDNAGQSDIAFLADGIQDELLTRLSLVRALKVTSRTSVEWQGAWRS